MKKNIKYIILLIISITWLLFFCSNSFAGFDIPWTTQVENSSMDIASNWDIVESINYLWFNVLQIVKLIIQGLLVIFMVYVWAQMIWSMGDDEETLTKSKRQIWYSILALLFINIPWSIYAAFHKTDHWTISKVNNWDFMERWSESNMFFDMFNFWYTFWDQVVWFLEVTILAVAIVAIIYEWLKIIISAWNEEVITKAKTKLLYSVLALIFVWIIQAWKSFAFSFEVSQATNIFSNLADLALFFAAPVAFFFLTIAAYYYITSAWDEEKVKKAKSIVINTILATLILLAAYTFLLDLANL